MILGIINNILIRNIIESFLNEEEILLYFYKIDVNEINNQYFISTQLVNYDNYIQIYDKIFNMEKYYSKKFNLRIKYNSFEYENDKDILSKNNIIYYDDYYDDYDDDDDYNNYFYHDTDNYYINDY